MKPWPGGALFRECVMMTLFKTQIRSHLGKSVFSYSMAIKTACSLI